MATEQTPGIAGLEAWNEPLLETLLPRLPEQLTGVSVLLACDEESIIAAAAQLDIGPDDAVAAFGRAVERHFGIAAQCGLGRVLVTLDVFDLHSDRSERIPPSLAVCALLTLAASRMTSGDGMHATNFYKRLWEVIGTQPGKRDPHGFQRAPEVFNHLARWLSEDLRGARGQLILRPSHPAYIGVAISQCLFRARDKEHLAEFFAHRVKGNAEHLDLLRLLQISSDSNYLTLPAQGVITDPELQDAASFALERLYAGWDGTVPDEHGGRYYPGVLHLTVRRQMALYLSAPDSDEERIPVPAEQLPALAAKGLKLHRDEGRPGVYVPATGATMLFELSEDSGLIWSRAPTQEQVFVLTGDPDLWLLAKYAASPELTAGLPRGWQLYERVPLQVLPEKLAQQSANERAPVKLTGGLRIAGGWLTGYQPRLEAGQLAEDLTVNINGQDAETLRSGSSVPLQLPEGDHLIEVGDGLASFTVHMLTVNPARPPYGQLGCSLSGSSAKAGASANPQEPYACGAALSEPYEGDMPLLFRSRTVKLLTAQGACVTYLAPKQPEWLTRVGFEPGSCRWELHPDEDVIWVLSGGSSTLAHPAPFFMKLDADGAAAVRALGEHPRVRAINQAAAARLDKELAKLRSLAERQQEKEAEA